MKRRRCPPDWRPGCRCSIVADEPRRDCHVHGYPDQTRCPYCQRFKRYTGACGSCGYDRRTRAKVLTGSPVAS